MIAADLDFKGWMSAVQARIEHVLEACLPSNEHIPARLHQAMRYAVLDGGKRVRPLLVFAAGELVGADPARLDHAAAAVELIHAYSLVHDDMPPMDNDVLRRGKPTVHVQYDEATALLAGDALQTAAFDALSGHVLTDDPREQLKMINLLAKASGSLGMCGGQGVDLYSVGKALNLPELELMHILKTGALIRASVLLGAHCGTSPGAEQLARLDHAAKCVGLAFQVVDDILDCEADSATLGKTAGKDAANDKPTYVSLLGLAAAKEKAAELQAQAHAALDTFGAPASRLKQVADFIVARRS
ncbi:Farnesyl diphosphate synthase [Andreprevotia sp. IGB-42]|uniref:polyprenyl synthetase family protein n=1 Tax=Andreprevotia sp. IGB-42 TaxID=2497473 RepID=UPI001356B9E0|nr:farnesyl diphosphate synthase [Andreprevotia sp. IGB-42]KAF0812177.1 Farnesyl diphosphate synthase [Andreprevotia sp. IGB-42]